MLQICTSLHVCLDHVLSSNALCLPWQHSMATCRWDELKKARAALWNLHDRCAAAQGPSGTGVDTFAAAEVDWQAPSCLCIAVTCPCQKAA